MLSCAPVRLFQNPFSTLHTTPTPFIPLFNDMGKKPKTKQRQRRKQQKQQQNESNKPSGPALVQRLSHYDPKIRHAALATLAQSTELLQRGPPSLLAAVRDQLISPDLHCSVAAAGCLGNYLLQLLVENTNEAVEETISSLTSGWMLVFLGRLQECTARLESLETESSIIQNPRFVLWGQLAEQCLSCVVYLLEGNPLVVERLSPHHMDQNSAQQLLKDLLTVITTFLGRSTIDPAVETLCCRCLHSVWDDNLELLQTCLRGEAVLTKTALQQLSRIAVSTKDQAPDTARMHSVGTLLSLWTMTLEGPIQALNNTLSPETLTACLVQLHESLIWDTSARKTQVVSLQAAKARDDQLQADCTLESEIVKEQERKKEPARLIARRLKEKKSSGTEGEAMQSEDTDKDQEMKDKDEASTEEASTEEIWETACRHWQQSIRPLQLALEVTVNLTTSGGGIPEDFDDGDDDEVMGEAEQPQQPPLDSRIQEVLLQHNIPDRLMQLLSTLFDASFHHHLPEVVVETVGDLQSKTAVGLCHCITATHWADSKQLWPQLRSSWPYAANDTAREALASTLVGVLRQDPDCSQDVPEDVEFILQHFMTYSNSSSPVVVRDGVCLLGILLTQSQPHHSAELNQTTTQSLLQILSSTEQRVSPMILSEILSVLMDIYGDDGRHPAIFDSLQVLPHIQKAVPVLKQRIGLVERTESQEDVEQWKETAMNATRFIQYKKGHGQ